MDAFFNAFAILLVAGIIGLALSALTVRRLRKDPGIRLERGRPLDPEAGWHPLP